MEYLPLFFDLKNKPCLIVGGGTIATRKARLLDKAGASIHVVAPKIDHELNDLAHSVTCKEYETADIGQSVLVISATDDETVNRQVSEDCHARAIPVNVVDSPSLCSVITPAIVDRSPLVVAISSGGDSPVLARRIRSQLESTLPAAIGGLGQLAKRYRDKVKSAFSSEELRRRFWEAVLNGPVAEKFLSGREDEAQADLDHMLETKKVSDTGEVYLVGAGPGDPDLLTFKALRLMQQAEVVLYDRLVSQPILEMTRRDADRVYVGKKRADHAVPQTQINEMLLNYAKQGKRVLRLKGGDPFIFGRGAEELDLLADNNIPFQVVPGITAASGCASYAGIPLTHRDCSQSVRFITGHLKNTNKDGSILEYPWKEFAQGNQTLVFYMGLNSLQVICDELIAAGKPGTTPAAIIEKGTLPVQRVHISDLNHLPQDIKDKDVHAPTLLIIGEVVKLHNSLNWYKS